MNDSMRPKNKKKSLILIIIMTLLICLFGFFLFYNIMHYLNVKKDISEYLKNNYKDYDIEYVEKKRCHSSGGVWFPHKISNCNMLTYILKNDYEQFELIITDNRNNKYYTRGLFAYSFENEICREMVSCTGGVVCGDTHNFVEVREEYNKGCVTVIKKY